MVDVACVTRAELQDFRPGELPHAILGIPVHAVGMAQAVQHILSRAAKRQSAMVCVANVHMLMEAYDCPAFRNVLADATLVVPDGMPLVWALRRQGRMGQERVAGPDLVPCLCKAAASAGLSVGLLGGRPEVRERAACELERRFPKIRVPLSVSPPFRQLTTAEDDELVEAINASGVGILLVALGCPKQERWMHEHIGRIHAVMVGVGAAIDFIGGAVPRAPVWMQRLGLEWLHRLASEPGRLCRQISPP